MGGGGFFRTFQGNSIVKIPRLKGHGFKYHLHFAGTHQL